MITIPQRIIQRGGVPIISCTSSERISMEPPFPSTGGFPSMGGTFFCDMFSFLFCTIKHLTYFSFSFPLGEGRDGALCPQFQLIFYQFIIFTFFLYQLFMCSQFNNFSFFQYYNLVGIFNGT